MEIKELGMQVPDDTYNLDQARLIEEAIINKECQLGPEGVLLATTGKYTGRSPKDRFLVDEKSSSEKIAWGKINQKISRENFDKLLVKAIDYSKNCKLYTTDCFCGADKRYRIKVRFITEFIWHSIFVRNMFLRSTRKEFEKVKTDFTVLNVSNLIADEHEKYGLRSEVFIVFDIERKIGIIGGTQYSGEMKKGIFSFMNYYLPQKGVFPMHCSANVGVRGDVALFFGLSGTGKTTISSDPERQLIGDDEHGWSDAGVFNFEGGCYAKTIKLSPIKEPTICNALRYGAILENVVYDQDTRRIDYDDASITENTRASYPVYLVDKVFLSGRGGHPKNIIFLTADAFGVLPPVARLTIEQAIYHFLSGYTSKVAGTERGIVEPQATFSACFGEPFMVLEPRIYGELLAKKVRENHCNVFLVNTGWCGGKYGVGHRIDLDVTRHIVYDILNESIQSSEYRIDEIFGFEVPKNLPAVDSRLLDPIQLWENKEEFKTTKENLAKMFIDNFNRFGNSLDDIKNHGPKL